MDARFRVVRIGGLGPGNHHGACKDCENCTFYWMDGWMDGCISCLLWYDGNKLG